MSNVAALSSYTEQLAPLASQHHASEYNRLKFGPKGCPVKYQPLSVQLPDIFQELRLRQEVSSLANPWWPSYKPSLQPPIVLESRETLPASVVTQLERDINAALSSSLDITVSPPVQLDPSIKTSSSHPINVSSVIPPELLSFVSSHVTPTPSSYPTVFTISQPFTLDRLAPPSPSTPYSIPAAIQSLSENRKGPQSVTEALRAALTDSFSLSWNSKTTSLFSFAQTRSLSLQSSPVIQTSSPSPPSLSLSLSLPILHPPNRIPALDGLPPLSRLNERSNPVTTGSRRTSPEDSPLESSLLLPPSPSIKLGNLFLSSCPGKKVRLAGPVRGRGGVCRDLETDLRRIKQLGVGCLICCLDDVELEFLGAPWPQYEALAQRTGLDVLRIPTPEGLAPLAPASLNAHLTRAIESYTLSGVHVLVHCRGGVGRAGVIACCWLIRLGICGWIDPVDKNIFSNGDTDGLLPPLHRHVRGVPFDTIRFVERIISVVRRRRSMKAIETYEQVQFIVDFVEHLRAEQYARAVL